MTGHLKIKCTSTLQNAKFYKFYNVRPYSGPGRLRQANLDSLSFASNLSSNVPYSSSRSPFYKSFFHKVLNVWKKLPFHIRNIPDEPNFKHKVTDFIWSELLSSGGISIPISPY